MDDIREQMDLAQEISTAISNPLGLDAGSLMDEDDLARELEELEQAQLDASLLDVSRGKEPISAISSSAGRTKAPVSSFANGNKSTVTNPLMTSGVGTTSISSPTNLSAKSQADLDEERELEELRASMAI